jgi:hypothetical protein
MAQQKISQSFNVSADKVVAFGELRKKRTEVYNANLSIPERLYLNLVDKPGSAVVGLGIAIKDAVRGIKKQGMYTDPATKEWYVSGAFINATMKDAQSLFTTSKFDEKINNLFCQAFDQCQDYSKSPVMRSLRPL